MTAFYLGRFMNNFVHQQVIEKKQANTTDIQYNETQECIIYIKAILQVVTRSYSKLWVCD